MDNRNHRVIAIIAATFAASAVSLSAHAAAAGDSAADLTLEDLLNTEVVTAARKAETLHATAAAAYVILREDIERSGATTIPEALRLAPGVEVAQIANNRCAVSVRGFNGRFADQLLVLMDGRSIYSPLFSGVLWEFEDTLIDDIERIEVIRGPGAAIWGANAVNGVINIITRKSRDTQGNLLMASTGNIERGEAAFRHGGATDDGYYRVWGKTFDRVTSEGVSGQAGNDYWRSLRAGFRRDGSMQGGSHYLVSGEAYSSPTGDRWNLANVASPLGYASTDIRFTGQGAHLLGRDEWVHDNGTESALQSYIDWQDINAEGELSQRRLTVDIDFQQHRQLGLGNDVVWGLGYRTSRDDIVATDNFRFSPERTTLNLASAFLQDEYALVPDQLRLIAGARLEHNTYTGFELQPNLRLAWTPTGRHTLWGAYSRAVHTPSRADETAQTNLYVIPAVLPFSPLPVLVQSVPGPGGITDSETVNTAELGYRQQLLPTLSLDAALFHSDYMNLRSAKLGAQQIALAPSPYVLQAITPVGAIDAHTQGLELTLDWQPSAQWRLQPTYSYLHVHGYTPSTDPALTSDAAAQGGTAPVQQYSLRTSWSPANNQQWDLWLRHVGRLSNADTAGTPIAAYTTADLRWSMRVTSRLDISATAKSLLRARHAEFAPDLLPSEVLQVERGFIVKVRYQF